MAKIIISKKTTVADLKQQFRDQVGATLRVFNGGKTADDNDLLVNLGAKVGEVEFRTSRTVGKFIQSMNDELNVKVKVRTADDWVTVLDGLTLATVKDLPKQTTKAFMEDFIGYQHAENEKSESNKTGFNTKSVKTKKIHLNLNTYYTDLLYFEVPKEQQENLINFLDTADEDEIYDALYNIGDYNAFTKDDLTIGREGPILSYEFANPYESMHILGDDEEDYVEDFGTRVYEFITINPDKTVTMNIPKNCPEWLIDTYIKPLCKFAENYIAEEDTSELDFNDPEMIADFTSTILSESQSKPWGDLTMPNYEHDKMMIGIAFKMLGTFEFEIEIPEKEKLDPRKFNALFFSNNEVQFLQEIDSIPLFGLIYDDTYYEVKLVDGDDKGRDMWVTNPESWKPLWPSYDDDDE